MQLRPRSCQIVDLKVRFKIPIGYCAILISRSSYASKGLWVYPGLIDANFDQSIVAIVYSFANKKIILEKGCRFCQILFLPYYVLPLINSNTLSFFNSTRGSLGSTGF